MKYNTIIIGGGMAGLTAGMYLARANLPCLILEGRFWGGQTALLNNVKNYPAVKDTTGFDISNTLYEQVKELNIDMKNELVIQVIQVKQVDNLYQVISNKSKYFANNIIIATGAKVAKLGLKEEDKFIGRGLSYCATCDGNLFKNKVVAIYGAGKTAVEDINYLHNLCDKVYWIVPNNNIASADILNIQDLNNVIIKTSSEIVKLLGDDFLQEVEIHNKKDNSVETIKVEGLFVTLGRNPDLSWLGIEIKTNKNGYVMVDKNCQTSHKGIFACGDIISRNLKQIVTACSDGAIASNYIITKR